MYRYANKRSGKISSIDVTNPLKVVVFYDDFNQIRLLDNTLSEITQINLNERFSDISACGTSNDGNLWIYDPIRFKLIKINDAGDIILETSNVNDFGMIGVNISSIKEKGNYVVLMDKQQGFYVFDNFGQYIFSYESKSLESFQFDGRNLFYYTSEGLISYSLLLKESTIIFQSKSTETEEFKYFLYNSDSIYEVFKFGINKIKR